MIEKIVYGVGFAGIILIVWIVLYAFSMRCVAKEDEANLPWRHAWWYAFHDTFFWARKLNWIEQPPQRQGTKKSP